jgi:hypothetical protein
MKPMSEIRLHFEGPYPVCSESADIFNGCHHLKEYGIYLWAVRMLSGEYRNQVI